MKERCDRIITSGREACGVTAVVCSAFRITTPSNTTAKPIGSPWKRRRVTFFSVLKLEVHNLHLNFRNAHQTRDARDTWRSEFDGWNPRQSHLDRGAENTRSAVDFDNRHEPLCSRYELTFPFPLPLEHLVRGEPVTGLEFAHRSLQEKSKSVNFLLIRVGLCNCSLLFWYPERVLHSPRRFWSTNSVFEEHPKGVLKLLQRVWRVTTACFGSTRNWSERYRSMFGAHWPCFGMPPLRVLAV